MGMLQGNGRRTWRRLVGAHVPVALATLAVLFTGAFVSGAVLVRNMRAAHANVQASSAQLRRPDPRAEGDWFQLSHFGKSHPAPDARAIALAQAARLPLSRLGSIGPKSSSPGQWTSLGPQPIDTTICNTTQNCTYYGLNSGRITAMAVNPTNNSDIWVGAADGGLWHSTNGGTNWTPVTDSQPTLSIGSIAIDTKAGSPYTIYVGTGEANLNGDAYWGDGVLRSADGGSTWTQLGVAQFAGLSIGKIVVQDPDPNNNNQPSILLTTSYNGFTVPPNGPTNFYKNLGIWYSGNSGATWTEVLTNPNNGPAGFDVGTDVAFDPQYPGAAYGALGNAFGFQNQWPWFSAAGIYFSSNGVTAGSPGSWNRFLAAPGGPDVERISLGVSLHTDPSTHVVTTYLYAAVSSAGQAAGEHFGDLLGATYDSTGKPTDGRIYFSNNDGYTWYAKSVVTGGAPEMVNDDGGSQWWYDNYTMGDLTDTTGNTAYIGGVDVWKTTDSGNTWTNLTNAYNYASTPVAGVHPDQHAFAFFAGNSSHPSYFYLGNDGGVWSGIGSTGSSSFTNLNGGGLNITQFYSGSIGETGTHPQLYGGSQDNGTVDYPTTPIGSATTWNEALGGDGGSTVVDYTDNSVLYASNPNGVFWKSIDGGANWNIADYAHNGAGFPGATNFIAPDIVSPNNHLELLAGSDQVFRTLDGTTSWTAISPVLDPYSCSTGTCGAPISALAIAPGHDNVIYAGDDFGDVFATTNSGSTWQTNTSFFCQFSMVTSLAVDPTNPSVAYATCAGFSSGAGGHIYKTTDAALHWTDISTNLPNIPVESMLVNPVNSSLLLAGSDIGVFTSPDGGTTWQQLGSGFPNVAIDQMFTNHAGTELFVATHGRGMWELTLPSFAATPPSILRTVAPGTTPTSDTITLSNAGFGALNWSLTSPLPSWMSSVTPTSGTVATGATQTLTITYAALSATPQTYTTTLTLADPHANNSPYSIHVTLVASHAATTWYFAEGYTGGNATEYLTIANPDPVNTATVTATYLLGSGPPIVRQLTVWPSARFTQVVNTVVGPNQNVSMILSSNIPIVAERPYYVTYVGTFGSLPSGTDVLGATALATQFDFANVDSSPGHDCWLTILNHNSSPMDVAISYFPKGGTTSPTIIHHSVPANSRGTVPVQYESGLPRAVYSATIMLSEPGLVERTLYEQADSVTGYPGAADVIGVATPQTSWDFAEGYSSATVNERYVLANPSTTLTAHATVTFYLPDGSQHAAPVATLAPGQQVSVAAGPIIGTGGVSNSAVVTSDQPILAERLMSSLYVGSAGCCYQTISAPGLTEVLGASQTGHLFEFAEGYTGGQVAEYLTILNPDPTNTASVTVTFLPANGSAPVVKVYAIGPHSRFTLYTNGVVPGQSFAMTLQSTLPVLAERPMSFIYNGFAPGSTDIIGYQPPGS